MAEPMDRIDHPARRIRHRLENTRERIPLRVRVVHKVERCIGLARPHVLHRRKQHAASPRRCPADRMAEDGEAHALRIPLDRTDRLVMPARILQAQLPARRRVLGRAHRDAREVRAVPPVTSGLGAGARGRRPGEEMVAAAVEMNRIAGLQPRALSDQWRELVEPPAQDLVGKVNAPVEVGRQGRTLQHGSSRLVHHAVAAGQREPHAVDGRGRRPVQQVAAPLVAARDFTAGALLRGGLAPEVAVGGGVRVAAHGVPLAGMADGPVEIATVGRAGARQREGKVEHHVGIGARRRRCQRLVGQHGIGRCRRVRMRVHMHVHMASGEEHPARRSGDSHAAHRLAPHEGQPGLAAGLDRVVCSTTCVSSRAPKPMAVTRKM
jgi:hypothetical protein